VSLECADTGEIPLVKYDPEPRKLIAHPSYVAGVVGADAQLNQPASGAHDDTELFATVGGRKGHPPSSQAEFGVVATGFLDVGNADSD
jgi:hypothetical protein